MIRRGLLTMGALSLGSSLRGAPAVQPATNSKIKHSAPRWCYSGMPLEELCDRGKAVGLHSVELLTADEWPVVQARGLDCAVGTLPDVSLTNGFNDPTFHRSLQEKYIRLARQAADAGVPQIIVFSGSRRGISDAVGLEHCARGLEPVVKEAETVGVSVILELFNSKINHPDYQADSTSWGAALVDKVGSDHFKLLYDIYHMQVQEGDVIATIRKYADYIGHYHTAGVPGRHEIDETQELYYPAIVRAIAETGFEGYIGQEFIPTGDDPIRSLAEGIRICTV